MVRSSLKLLKKRQSISTLMLTTDQRNGPLENDGTLINGLKKMAGLKEQHEYVFSAPKLQTLTNISELI